MMRVLEEADDRIVWKLRLDGGEPVQIRDSAKAVPRGGFFIPIGVANSAQETASGRARLVQSLQAGLAAEGEGEKVNG